MKNLISTILFIMLICIPPQVLATNTGHMIITGFHGKYSSEHSVIQTKQLIKEGAIGGVIIFKRNIKNKAQLKELIAYLKKDTPIIVAIDHEGGLVNRLTHPSFKLKTPSPKSFCKLSKKKQLLYSQQAANSLSELGINVNLGGVVDIAPIIKKSSICKYNRCFSDTQETIEQCTSTMFNFHQKNKVVFALKHYPGHGSTPIDSHYYLPDITKTHSDYEFMPYFNITKNNQDMAMVMVGHLMDKTVDKRYPASLSKKHIQHLTNIVKFNGLIITDDLNMGALYGISRKKHIIAKLAANAGNHLLLFEQLTPKQINKINDTLSLHASEHPQFNKNILTSKQKVQTLLLKYAHSPL